jgi:hypothetical protein
MSCADYAQLLKTLCLTTTRYSCYARNNSPFYFLVEKLGLGEAKGERM